jgi:hypothetical protein
MTPRTALLMVAIAAVAATSVPATRAAQRSGGGSIRGRVELNRLSAPSEGRPMVSGLGMTAARDLSERLRSVVYLETAPRGAFEQNQRARVVMDQRNETFVPHLLAITTGTSVDFPNSDRIYHNVFSLSKTPGIVRVFCDIHSHMSAFILVFNHPFFDVTGTDGRYRIDAVPPGTYSVVAWNEGLASEPKSVTIADGAIAELDFALR